MSHHVFISHSSKDDSFVQSNQAELFNRVFQAIQQRATAEAKQYLDEWSKEDHPLWAKALAAGLRAILRGDRDSALAADPNLS